MSLFGKRICTALDTILSHHCPFGTQASLWAMAQLPLPLAQLLAAAPNLTLH
jgi:hypothetical protein